MQELPPLGEEQMRPEVSSASTPGAGPDRGQRHGGAAQPKAYQPGAAPQRQNQAPPSSLRGGSQMYPGRPSPGSGHAPQGPEVSGSNINNGGGLPPSMDGEMAEEPLGINSADRALMGDTLSLAQHLLQSAGLSQLQQEPEGSAADFSNWQRQQQQRGGGGGGRGPRVQRGQFPNMQHPAQLSRPPSYHSGAAGPEYVVSSASPGYLSEQGAPILPPGLNHLG